MYQSNYEAGLRILQLNEETFELSEVAYFDIYPGANQVDFYGTWSNYPYFTGGINSYEIYTPCECLFLA